MATQKPMNLGRALVFALLCAPFAAASDATYNLMITPRQPVLGDQITASLDCVAGVNAQPETVTFDHASLTIIVQVQGAAEPSYAFPNRRVLTEGDLLIRESSSQGREKLKAGEHRFRSVEITRLFPRELIEVGDVAISYTLYDGTRLLTSPVVHFHIKSSPAAVDRLLARLHDSDLAVRGRAAALLHRMTAREFEFDAAGESALRNATISRWTDWWHVYGAHMKWEPSADSVISAPTAVHPLQGHTGAVVYPRRQLDLEDRAVWIAAMQAWIQNPSLPNLQAQLLVADRRFSYPSDVELLSPDVEMLELLTKAIALIPMTPTGQEDALILLRTVARMPDASLAAPVSRLAAAMPDLPSWSQARIDAAGLLDLLAPDGQVH